MGLGGKVVLEKEIKELPDSLNWAQISAACNDGRKLMVVKGEVLVVRLTALASSSQRCPPTCFFTATALCETAVCTHREVMVMYRSMMLLDGNKSTPVARCF
jgi:hypothetical protein